MPKPSPTPERKVARAGLGLGVVLAGLVVAAHVSDARHPQAPADEQAISTAVSSADPAPAHAPFGLPFSLPTPGSQAAPRLALVSRASGDPRLATGFGHLRTLPPQVYANLAVYPISRTAPSAPPLALTTLGAAMGNGVVSVVEPSLSVTNVGPQPAYVPGGEVVPGGSQDQGVASDAIVPAGSQKVSLASFCVEEGRSYGPSSAFQADVAMAIPAVRYAMQAAGDQSLVWGAVASATGHFGTHTDTGAYDALEQSRTAQAAAQPYVAALTLPAAPPQTVGAVVAINGRIVCADVYRDPALFAQMWPALLRSYALQAAMCPQGGTGAAPAPDAAHWLASLDAAPGAQDGSSSGTLSARVATPVGVGVRTAVTGGAKSLLHEAFWTPQAALAN